MVIATGEEVLYQEDFSVPGLFPVEFIRGYRSSHQPYGAGSPVAREATALDDIQEATKMRPEFHPYN
ncbi:DUF6531 domain-containing protein [Azovibrio restrictus]|uniref:DUF6531 domain-containing protein n=1 Tax=Azovibrio restrictus TaxID=146938 RepID=UPI00041340C2|nr:DUF6531 domain-containing protein [Azovibrio restrictus]